ncbi:hypothetical protein EVAR_12365_1 [Eumeta japonica]|uniref:Uncharacterized protein n=1 Tax=Eumeta variegata TaxID=151549 RepID=A0A4C1WYR0_EUMVA|nr:hypothetical protein EVAR_12365_1 [Eumeta japonica]
MEVTFAGLGTETGLPHMPPSPNSIDKPPKPPHPGLARVGAGEGLLTAAVTNETIRPWSESNPVPSDSKATPPSQCVTDASKRMYDLLNNLTLIGAPNPNRGCQGCDKADNDDDVAIINCMYGCLAQLCVSHRPDATASTFLIENGMALTPMVKCSYRECSRSTMMHHVVSLACRDRCLKTLYR